MPFFPFKKEQVDPIKEAISIARKKKKNGKDKKKPKKKHLNYGDWVLSKIKVRERKLNEQLKHLEGL